MSGNRTFRGQQHGYRSGHQLLTASIKLPRSDQDVVDRLSDISGPLRPGQIFEPYLTGYCLPSATHYVLAKTWQDRAAPRAGCVITYSLFIPMTEWEEGLDVKAIFKAIGELSPNADASGPLHIPDGDALLAPVRDEQVSELVEALFLEERRPIVVFDVRAAELIAQRLLLSLWPEVRSSFSVCTFALGPRKIGGRDFDLAFAPKEARTRFADWAGRRIEPSTTPASGRHRWTSLIAERVFAADKPSLLFSSLPIELLQNKQPDESILRLSLLWDELSQKASVSTNAALGMLDIVNSQGVAHEAMPRLAPVLEHAISLAESSTDLGAAWSFLATLMDKLPGVDSEQLASSVHDAAQSLAIRAGHVGVEFLLALKARGRDMPEVLLSGLGDGLAISSEQPLLGWASEAAYESAIQLMAASAPFAKSAVSAISASDVSFVAELVREISGTDIDTRGKLRENILPNLHSIEVVPFLAPLLAGADEKHVLLAVRAVEKNTNFQYDAFDHPLIAAAIEADALDSVRRIALGCQDQNAGERFILHSLRPEQQDIEWLATEVPDERRLALMILFLAQVDDFDLQRLLRHEPTRDTILATLGGSPRDAAAELSRLLSISTPPLSDAVQYGGLVLPWLVPDEREQLASRLVERILSEATVADENAADYFFELAAPEVPARQLVRFSTPMSAPSARVAHNLVLLSHSNEIACSVANHIGELVERLVRRRRENLGERGYAAWAHLLSLASTSAEAAAQAAAATFEYAANAGNQSVSPLAIVSFPIFYSRLPDKSKGGIFWSEIDRKKSARRILVDAYVRSKWPPADLVLIAIEAGIAKKVVGRLSRNYQGRAYISAIERDAKRLSAKEKGAVFQVLGEYRENNLDLDF